MRNKVISILFCLILISGVAVHLFTADKYYSENEKRTLKQFPKISWEQIRSGKFGDEIEGYLADQFPGRDGWVTVKTLSEKLSGKKESGGVYFADDGYLIEIHKDFSNKQIVANIEAVKQLQDALVAKKIPLRVMLVPTAGDILSDKLPAYAPNANQQAVIEYAKKQGLNIVDVTAALAEHKTEYIFYKTDHHWTSLGSYYAYAEWMRDKGMTPDSISAWKKEQLCDNFRGTTYAKVNYPFAAYDVIDAYYKAEKHRVDYNNGNYVADSIYERKFLDGTDQYAVFLNSNQSTTVVNGNGNGKCLIIKDSYANCFAQFCIDDYEETHLIDMRFFRGSVEGYIKENGISEVLVLYNIPNFTSDTGITRCAR
ncbi:MAG: hypothetical protein K6E85_03230 [Lachnospiraceae bacterium]|nr:hypothetical protein [Lachnospiraceae bacterium]